jgi:hypothetical protein
MVLDNIGSKESIDEEPPDKMVLLLENQRRLVKLYYPDRLKNISEDMLRYIFTKAEMYDPYELSYMLYDESDEFIEELSKEFPGGMIYKDDSKRWLYIYDGLPYAICGICMTVDLDKIQ